MFCAIKHTMAAAVVEAEITIATLISTLFDYKATLIANNGSLENYWMNFHIVEEAEDRLVSNSPLDCYDTKAYYKSLHDLEITWSVLDTFVIPSEVTAEQHTDMIESIDKLQHLTQLKIEALSQITPA